MPTKQRQGTGTYPMSLNGWPPERWAAVLVIGSLLLLVLIRRGFRGVNVLGAKVSV